MPIITTPRPPGAATPACARTAPAPSWIAHAGGAIGLRGGAPTPGSLAGCVELGCDWIELDVCATSDGHLVLRHDTALGSGQPLATLTLHELRRREPEILTLPQGREVIGIHTPLLLDIKTELAVPPLARQLSGSTGSPVAVCTENLSCLTEMRSRAPRIARWLSLPDMGSGSYESVRNVVTNLLNHRHHGGLGRLGRELGAAVREARSNPLQGLGRLGGSPWRAHLPHQVRWLARQVGASALSLHHWIVTPEVCAAAHADGLPVAAWTVNRADTARRLVGCGVDFVTSDQVGAMRAAVERQLSGGDEAPSPAAATPEPSRTREGWPG